MSVGSEVSWKFGTEIYSVGLPDGVVWDIQVSQSWFNFVSLVYTALSAGTHTHIEMFPFQTSPLFTSLAKQLSTKATGGVALFCYLQHSVFWGGGFVNGRAVVKC